MAIVWGRYYRAGVGTPGPITRPKPNNCEQAARPRSVRDHEAMDPEDVAQLRSELEEWRRRAEVAEAIAAERLVRAETAERALRAAEAALAGRATPAPQAGEAAAPPAAAAGPERRPASLLERWRRYTETIN